MVKTNWVREGVVGQSLTDNILISRGIKNKEYFLRGTIWDIPDGMLLNDMDKAIPVIKEAIKNGVTFVIYSDYDVDGAIGAVVAYLMLKELGANVYYYTNNRFTQGYGMVVSGIDEIIQRHPDVKIILTVDNGISAHGPIDYANSLGLQVIVTDHHEQSETLPNAVAVINPKRNDSTYPFDGICGATVVWKLLRELYVDRDKANEYLDILAIATVGDVVPILEENRIIVKEGLKLLRDEKRLSLRILKELTKTADISSHFTLAFLYVPIFNAVGRLEGDITKVIQLLTSENEDECRTIVEELININEDRKAMTVAQVAKAEEILEVKGIKDVIVVYDESFSEGIIGLIAGRLKEKYNRPTFAFTKSETGVLKASGRSIEPFPLKKNLDTMKEVMLGYGGHALAAGLSIEADRLSEFEDRMLEIAKDTLVEKDFEKNIVFLDEITENQLSFDMIEELEELEPYGAGFPKPLLKLKDFNVRRAFFMGKDGVHLKLLGEHVSIIAWRQTREYEKMGNPLKVTSLGYPSKNIYNNNVSIQFMIENDNFKETN